MSIDFHRLTEAIDNNPWIIIDYINYIDCLPMIDFHRLGTPGALGDQKCLSCLANSLPI